MSPGYYSLGNSVLVELIEHEVGYYAVIVLAVTTKASSGVRRRLLSNSTDKYVDAEGRIRNCYTLVKLEDALKWKPVAIRPEELETLKLLYNGDQSAVGTTVEALTADSTVSDAKSGGGQNANTKY